MPAANRPHLVATDLTFAGISGSSVSALACGCVARCPYPSINQCENRTALADTTYRNSNARCACTHAHTHTRETQTKLCVCAVPCLSHWMGARAREQKALVDYANGQRDAGNKIHI